MVCGAGGLAGNRKGEDDDRGILFYNSYEFIMKNRPRFFIFENVKGLKDIYGAGFKKLAAEQLLLIEDISGHVAAINSGVTALINERKTANKIEDANKKAVAYCDKVKPLFDTIRYHCDKLELLIDDELWPLTKYRELLFTK